MSANVFTKRRFISVSPNFWHSLGPLFQQRSCRIFSVDILPRNSSSIVGLYLQVLTCVPLFHKFFMLYDS